MSTSSVEIGNNILQQLGGNRFIVMTGAKHLGTSGNDLSFKIPCRKVTHVHITLEPTDTYKVAFTRIRKFKATPVSEFSGVYAHQLQALFTEQTGLNTHL